MSNGGVAGDDSGTENPLALFVRNVPVWFLEENRSDFRFGFFFFLEAGSGKKVPIRKMFTGSGSFSGYVKLYKPGSSNI